MTRTTIAILLALALVMLGFTGLVAASDSNDGIGYFDQHNGRFALKNDLIGGAADFDFSFGSGGDSRYPVAGDWNGDGDYGIGYFDQTNGRFALKNDLSGGSADYNFTFGSGGASVYPVAGDWNGDGSYGIGFVDQSDGRVALKNDLSGGSADYWFTLGSGGASRYPVAGDWNGDGDYGIGYVDQSDGRVALRNDLSGGVADYWFTLGSGGASRYPVVGDWNDDGSYGIGYFDQLDGRFALKDDLSGGVADYWFTFGSGGASRYPVAGLWEVVDPDPDELEVVSVSAITDIEVEFGTDFGDVPLPDEVPVTLSDNSNIIVDVDWDEGPYDSSTAGDYDLTGELVNLPGDVTNPANLTASVTVTVAEEDVVFDPEATVYNRTDLIRELNRRTPSIEFGSNISLEGFLGDELRVLTDGLELDMGGYELDLDGKTIAFEGDNISIWNGTFADCHAPGEGVVDLPPSNGVMVAGQDATFTDVTFNAFFRDWYQVQSPWAAAGLTMNNCTFNLPAIIISNVVMNDANINAALGIRNDAAVLNSPTLNPNPVHDFIIDGDDNIVTGSAYGWAGFAQGILYIYADAQINDLHLNGGFTGIYVGKDLKYYGETKKVEVELNDAKVTSTKDEQSWIAIQADKAQLITSGVIDITDVQTGLTLVGRGLITGDATFTNSNVFIGWQTEDFIVDKGWSPSSIDELYGEREIYGDQRVKAPPIYVDYQAACKDNCYLTISGSINNHPTFESDVYIFDTLQDVFERDVGSFATAGLPAWDNRGGVMFGNVTLEDVYMWGNFTIVDSKEVVFDKLELQCGKERHIFTADTGTSFASPSPPCDKDRGEPGGKGWYFDNTIIGTLSGGTITSDTKEENLLVLGDGLLVKDALFHRELYSVDVRSATLENVNIEIGERNPEWSEVTIVENSHATFDGVRWSPNTHVRVMTDGDSADQAKLTFAGAIENEGTIKFETFAAIGFANGTTFSEVDPRDGHSTEITEGGGYVRVDAVRAATPGWNFNDWKNDIWIEADDRMVSTKYEFRVEVDGEMQTHIIDLRDADKYPWATEQGIAGEWLTTILGLDRDAFGDNPISLRIAADTDKTFELTACGWFLNCCTQQMISLGCDTKEVSPEGKDIQPYFQPYIDVDKPLVEGDRLIVGWTVENTGGKEGTQTVTREIIVYDKAGGQDPEDGESWSGPETITLQKNEEHNFNVTNQPTDSGKWYAEEGYEFILILTTENTSVTKRVPVVAGPDEPAIFEPSVTVNGEDQIQVNVEETVDVDWSVENTGASTGTKTVTRSVLVDLDGEDPHMWPVLQDTVPLDAGETWTAGTGYTSFTAQGPGTYELTISTPDGTDTAVVTVVEGT